MTNDTASPANRQSFPQLYARIPKDWEPDSAYRLNLEVVRNDEAADAVYFDPFFIDGLRDQADPGRAWPLLLSGMFYLAAAADPEGLTLNPAAILAPLRGIGAKRAPLVVYLLEQNGVIFRTDAP